MQLGEFNLVKADAPGFGWGVYVGSDRAGFVYFNIETRAWKASVDWSELPNGIPLEHREFASILAAADALAQVWSLERTWRKNSLSY